MKEYTSVANKIMLPLMVLMAFTLASCSTFLTQAPPEQTGGGSGGGGAAVPVEAQGGGTGGGGIGNVNTQYNGYVVQLLASSSDERAQQVVDYFISEGYQSFVTPIIRNGQTLYRVQIGPYASEQEANNQLTAMRQRYQDSVFVDEAFINHNQ